MTMYHEDWERPDDKDNPIEIYAMEMLKQLEINDREKTIKFQDMTIEQLVKLDSREFQQRYQNASEMSDAEIELNSIHMGNYFYFLWSQIRFKKGTE